MKKNILSYVVVATVLLVFITNLISPLRVYSRFENRYLSGMPKLSFNLILNNQFSLDYEKYVNDQFILRDHWITLKSFVENSMLKQENNDIYFGKDRFLFEKMIAFSNQLEKNARYMDEFLEKYKDYPISVVIPLSSYMVYQDKLPKHAPNVNQYEWLKQYEKVWSIIDIHKSLLNADQQVYYRNDHHWTLEGAYLAYHQIMSELNMQPKQWEALDVKKTEHFLGTYFSKGKPWQTLPDQLKYIDPIIQSYQIGQKILPSLIDESKLLTFDKYSAFLHGNHGFASITVNQSENPTRLLVIKDSFANSLVPFLVDHYDVIDVIDLRGFSGSIESVINAKEYNHIIFLHSFSQFSTDSSVAKLRY
jgi:hypothetical protein